MAEVEEAVVCLRVLLIAVVDDGGADDAVGKEGTDIIEVIEEVRLESLGGFDFVGFHLVDECAHDIDLALALIPVERQHFLTTRVGAVLHEVIDNHVLEEIAAQRMHVELFGGGDAEQEGCKPRVIEIQLWGLGQTLADVGVVGLQKVDDVGGVEDAQPATYRIHRHTYFIGDG